MEEIAGELNTSVKSLYRKRMALSERLGAENFNEACLFIFKTNCWAQVGTILGWGENKSIIAGGIQRFENAG